MRINVNVKGLAVEISARRTAEGSVRTPRIVHLPMHQRLVKWFGDKMPLSIAVAPASRPHAAESPNGVNAIAGSVHKLADLDDTLRDFKVPPDATSNSAVVRLDYADRGRLLDKLAQRLLTTLDHPEPYRSLARSSILEANDALPPKHRQDLSGLKHGSMFANCEQAVDCGVPVDVAAHTFGVRDEARIEFLKSKAAYAAAGHIYAGFSVTDAAEVHGITYTDLQAPDPRGSLQEPCVERVAGAAVVCGMPPAEAARKYGITFADEIDRLHVFAREEETSALMKALARGAAVDGAYRDYHDDNHPLPRVHAEYIAAMSAATANALRAGESPDGVAQRLNILNPFVRRLLVRRAAELG